MLPEPASLATEIWPVIFTLACLGAGQFLSWMLCQLVTQPAGVASTSQTRIAVKYLHAER